MEKILIYRNDKAISERVADYERIGERLNTAILAVLSTGVKLDDNQLAKVLDAGFLTEEADRQARAEAQQRSSFAFTGASIDTRQLCAKLEEVAKQIAKEVKWAKVWLGYFTFKDGKAALNREKLQADLEEANSIYAATEEQAEAWRLAQEAKAAIDAYLAYVQGRTLGAPYFFAPLATDREWQERGLITVGKDAAKLDPQCIGYIR